jgi:FkbM family methyltransferase
MDIGTLARTLVPRPVRNFLRGPRDSVRWLKNDVSARLGRSKRVRMRGDWEIDCHPESHDAFSILKSLTETREELDAFIDRCAPGMIFVDVGAHFGIFTLAALRYGGDDARVFAIEPSPVPNAILRKNLVLAGSPPNVELLDLAIGPADGELSMLSTGAHGNHFLVASERPRRDATRVKQWTLPTLFQHMGRPPTHLKMDIEGFEVEAIDGGLSALAAHRPLFFLELHAGLLRNRGCDPLLLLKKLSDCGYSRFELEGRAVPIEEVVTHQLPRIVCS